MNDVDRWVNLEGPEPEGIRDLLDAAREVPDMTPEQEARIDARFYAAVAEDRRRWERRRAVKRALVWALAAACLALAVVLALRLAAPSDLLVARRLLPNAPWSPNKLGSSDDAPSPSSSAATPRHPPPRGPATKP